MTSSNPIAKFIENAQSTSLKSEFVCSTYSGRVERESLNWLLNHSQIVRNTDGLIVLVGESANEFWNATIFCDEILIEIAKDAA